MYRLNTKLTIDSYAQEKQGKKGNGQIYSLSGKTQGILFAQVVNSLLLTIQDIARFAANFSNFSKSVLHMEMSRASEIDTGKLLGRQGKHREFANQI